MRHKTNGMHIESNVDKLIEGGVRTNEDIPVKNITCDVFTRVCAPLWHEHG
ncbi:hypothetical protein GCM10011391_22840 [Pullulanibacillus camelliae]|uniref:Uncharacterized protein n=1 Tax=Pullulanibacillus camelliae TaxID=1707096 RepID=A0A8J2YHT7_9BACL|nr:hypothetical protein GCM10011391_22840 [Pullulanibacillus camelliae]